MKIFSTFFLCCISFASLAQTASDVTFRISGSTTVSPPTITLTWRKAFNVNTYLLSRKLRGDVAWTTIANNIAVNDTVYTDNTVSPGTGYEYRVSSPGLLTTGYVYASIGLPAKHYMGRLILVVDSTYINTLASEIRLFETDLIKEGWTITRINAGRNQPVTAVKQLIRNAVMAAPNEVKGLVLLGHIPVPYSGSLNPDGHPDHSGAWPCDAYYCDTVSNYWSDVTVNNVAATRPENQNIPGDGKFDQTTVVLAGKILYCGRIDVFNMPAFDTSDTNLMKRYLQKDHDYRSSNKTFRMRGLIDDNFGYFSGEAFAQNGFRNMASLLHPDSVVQGDYFPDLKANSYLWSYGCGGGWYQGAGGVGSTPNFQTDTVQTVFTMLFGSYFGDWDNQDNFLRAPLAAPGNALTNCWAGRPNYFFHHMGLGEPIGNSYLETVKNPSLYHPYGYGAKYVHMALLGDPSLKMYPYKGPASLTVDSIHGGSIAAISWLDSPDPQVLGYYVYRSASLADSFKLLNANYTVNTSFNDSSAPAGKNIYMVRAVKLQPTNTGTFYNLSPGLYDSTSILIPFAVHDMNAINDGIQLYPNPAHDFVYLSSTERELKFIEIFAMNGALLYASPHKGRSAKISLGNYSPGIYEVRLQSDKGISIRSLRIQ